MDTKITRKGPSPITFAPSLVVFGGGSVRSVAPNVPNQDMLAAIGDESEQDVQRSCGNGNGLILRAFRRNPAIIWHSATT
jgi:hypothetical protein